MLDLEQIDEPDAAYDVVLCRDGLMFALDPAQALREMRAYYDPADAWPPSCGDRVNATRGSASCSTR